MTSNKTPSPFRHQPYLSPKPSVIEDTLERRELQIERKTFFLTLKENPRGRFLRITEECGGRRDTIIIPSTGLEDFLKLANEIVRASNDLPTKIGLA